MKFRVYGITLIGLLIMVSLLSACSAISTQTPKDSTMDPEGTLVVRSVEVVMLESFPVQVSVKIKGELPDGCSTISPVNVQRDTDTMTFAIKLTPVPNEAEACTKQPALFEQAVALDVVDLPAGTYTVDVNGRETTFTLAVDNTLTQDPQGDEVGMYNPASKFCEDQGYTIDMRTDAANGQYGVCMFTDGSECDEWAFFRGECISGTDISKWPEYTNPQYGFSLRIPPDWVSEEIEEPDNTMSGHQLKLIAQPESNRKVEMIISFKKTSEDQMIWPTGTGEGEFDTRNTVSLLGQPVNRNVLVCEKQDMSVYYQQDGGVKRDNLEFALILHYVGLCTDGYSIPAEIQSLADIVVGSIRLLP